MNKKKLHLDEIELRLIVEDILKNFWLIALAAIIGFYFCKNFISIFYVNQYTSNAVYAVNVTNNNATLYQNLTVSNAMAQIYSKVFIDDIMEKEVLEYLGWEELNGKIHVSMLDATNLIEVSVTSPSAEDAFLINDSIKNVYVKVAGQIYDNAELKMVRRPDIPIEATNILDLTKISIYAAIVAFVLTLMLVVLISISRETIKTEEELHRRVDANLLGILNHYRGYKAIQIQSIKGNPGNKKYIRVMEEYARLATQMEFNLRKKGHKVLALTSVLENEGKTTIAANLARELAAKGRSVALVDSDFKNPSQRKILEQKINRNKDLGQYLLGNITLEEAMIYVEQFRFAVFAAGKPYMRSHYLITSQRFVELVENLKKKFDYVIIDTPPIGLVSETENVVDIADASLLVVQQDKATAEEINENIDILARSNSEFLGCIVNNYKTFHKEKKSKPLYRIENGNGGEKNNGITRVKRYSDFE